MGTVRAVHAEVGQCRPFLTVTGIVFSPPLQKIQQLSEGSMFGHGLKHLFHSRRRSREREHQNSQDSLPPHYGMSDHDSPDEKERSPEMHRVSYAMSLHDLPARPTAFNRVLQQIRSRPSIKRGTSLHSGSRRAKSSSLEPQKGSPHLVRKAPQDSSLTAILHQHQGRPRSSSTTDTAILLAESGTVYLLTEDTECLADKVGLCHGGILGQLGGTSPCGGQAGTGLGAEHPKMLLGGDRASGQHWWHRLCRVADGSPCPGASWVQRLLGLMLLSRGGESPRPIPRAGFEGERKGLARALCQWGGTPSVGSDGILGSPAPGIYKGSSRWLQIGPIQSDF